MRETSANVPAVSGVARVVREATEAPSKPAAPDAMSSFYAFHTPQFGEVAAALATAQGQFSEVQKNMEREVKSKRSDMKFKLAWATLDVFLAAVRPVLSASGLAVVQLPMVSKGAVVVKTVLVKGEQMIWNFCAAPLEAQDAWAVSSATTYARKTGLSSLLGIAAEDDDEGTAASGNRFTDDDGDDDGKAPRPTPRPAQRQSAKPAPVAPQPAAKQAADGDSVEGKVTNVAQKEGDKLTTYFALNTGLRGWTRDTSLALALENAKVDDVMVRATVVRKPGASPELVDLAIILK